MDISRFKNCKKLFKDKIKDNDDPLRYLDFIVEQNGFLKTFVLECLKQSKYQVTEYEAKVAEIALDLFIRKGHLTEFNHQLYTDIAVCAAYLHNVYFDEENLCTSLFRARERFDSIANNAELYKDDMRINTIPEEVREMIWAVIEAQLGESSPISTTIPSLGSPQETFATAVWIVRNAPFWFGK